MATVLPPWKLELIEKKKRRLEGEKAKEKEKVDRFSSLPEWKRCILFKRKGVQSCSEDPSLNDDKPSSYSAIDNDHSQTTSKKCQRPTSDDGRKPYTESNSSDERVIPQEKLQNGNQVEQHSFVANCLSQSDKQREDSERIKLSVSNSWSRPESVGTKEGEESRVYYEHIKTPSELRKLYESQAAKRKALEATQQSKDLSLSTQSKSGPFPDSQVCLSNTTPQTLETPAKEKECTDFQPSGTLNQDDYLGVQTQRKIKFSQEDSLQAVTTPVLNEINQRDTSLMKKNDCNKDISKHELQNGEEISSEIHVDSIRNKFGPSGYFHLRSFSSDNLLKSSSDTTPSSSPKLRTSPLNKRWSMVSLPRSNEMSNDDQEVVPHPKSHHGHLQRAKSMGDLRGEHHHHHENVNLRHRASVSHDIEHRIHELLQHLSISDESIDDNDDHMFSEHTPQSPSDREVEEEPRKERRASWFSSEEAEKAAKLLHVSHLIPDETSSSSYNKVIISKNDEKPYNQCVVENEEITTQKPVNKLFNSRKKGVTIIEKEEIVIGDSQLPGDPSKPDLHDSDIAVNGEVPDDLTTKGPSVHKLSALFGSSILKESKSSKQTKKADSKNNNAKQPKQEPKADSKKSDSKGTSSSRKFPWIKKGGDKKKDNLITNNDTTIETKFPFEGAQGLRPVQKKYAEHKITANMTLVIGADANFKNNQTYNHVKKTANYSNSLSPTTNKSKSIPESSIHSKKQSTNIDHDDEYITIIDVPDTSSHDDIQVSAIDIPSPSPSPTPISVIDMPEQKDSGVKVSIIDVPQDSDSDSDSATSGSYEVNPSDASSNVFTFNIDNSESVDGEEKEEEEDIDNVPVSYFGDSSYMKVPEVIFETEREDVKSCLSGPLRIRKRKGKVVFHSEKLLKIHDYPSELCLQSHFDDMVRENGGLAKYQPSSLQNVNLAVGSLRPNETSQVRDKSSKDEMKENATKITYSDEGEGFSSSSGSSGALLF